jgi:hypothetical protein
MDSELINSWNRILTLDEIVTVDHKKTVTVEFEDAQRLCWHCCHPWNGQTVMYPFAFDDRSQKFKLGGQFCSWECVKGYARDTMSRVLSGVHQINIRYYRKKMTGMTDSVMPAPPKIVLKSFGGHMTIDEFRKPNKDVEFVPEYGLQTKLQAYNSMQYKTSDRNVVQSTEERPLTIGDTSVTNEHLKLRRSKPLNTQRQNLETMLGLNSFAGLIKNHDT